MLPKLLIHKAFQNYYVFTTKILIWLLSRGHVQTAEDLINPEARMIGGSISTTQDACIYSSLSLEASLCCAH